MTGTIFGAYKMRRVRGHQEFVQYFFAPCCHHYEFAMREDAVEDLMKVHSRSIKCASPDCGKTLWLFAIGRKIYVTDTEVFSSVTTESQLQSHVIQLHGYLEVESLDVRVFEAEARMKELTAEQLRDFKAGRIK